MVIAGVGDIFCFSGQVFCFCEIRFVCIAVAMYDLVQDVETI